MHLDGQSDSEWFEAFVIAQYGTFIKLCDALVAEGGFTDYSGGDLAHEAFSKAREKQPPLYSHANPKAWLYKVAYYVYLNEVKKRKIRRAHTAFSLNEVLCDFVAAPERESVISDEL